eukprot:10472692-Alexandrium_andersonii.AAC.1
MAEGVFPSHRHDGTPWTEAEATHSAMAGKIMTFPCVLLFLKGDWAEFCERLGLPTWGSSLRP